MKNEKLKHKGLIIFVSILIPLVVLILFNVGLPNVEPLYSYTQFTLQSMV